MALNTSKLLSSTLSSLSKSTSKLLYTSKRGFHTSTPLFTGFSRHIPDAENTLAMPFNFTKENHKEVKKILAKYPELYQQSAVIPLLDLAQRQAGGWLPLAAINKVAEITKVPVIKVYEVVSFYTMFNRTKVGKYHVQVCCTPPCMLRGAYDILHACEKDLGIKSGTVSITKDGLFTLSEVECLGACVNAPMMQINDDYYEDLTPETAVKVLSQLRKGENPKIGPQIPNRKASDGPQGKTTLLEPPAGPFCREL
eukprot:TRINITY_DN4030_c1_g1_i1.p1 TRINITY_DN4030_c1_g1~~TRINITY_DN4030_c1_g1_i1.p1  ORF type:complete len:254 (+),score=53.35 TRINITY_DN4030_c1_g1_i1:90-851(+)